MTRIALAFASLSLLLPAPARPDASLPPNPGTPPPTSRYSPTEPLPPGFAPVKCADCVGTWARDSSMAMRAAEARASIHAMAPRAVRPSLKQWAREQWPRLHGTAKDFARALHTRELRIWVDVEGRYAAETDRAFSCRECDPIWRARRVQESGAGVIFVDVVVYGFPSAEERALLRRAFIDGPLGAPR